MALSARPSVGQSLPSVPSGHQPSGGRNVASASYSPIDEIAAQTDVHPDAHYSSDDFSGSGGGRRSRQEPLHNIGSSNLDMTSDSFLALLGQEQVGKDGSKPTSGVKGAFQGLLSKAIRAYEGTASVIHGEAQPRGASLSMSL